jgi:hypothetical protein
VSHHRSFIDGPQRRYALLLRNPPTGLDAARSSNFAACRTAPDADIHLREASTQKCSSAISPSCDLTTISQRRASSFLAIRTFPRISIPLCYFIMAPSYRSLVACQATYCCLSPTRHSRYMPIQIYPFARCPPRVNAALSVAKLRNVSPSQSSP